MVPYEFVASGNNSVVECDLAKVEVAGSNPVSRSNLRSCLRTRVSGRLASQSEGCPAEARAPSEGGQRYLAILSTRTSQISAPSPSGKAEVCKTSIPGSNPGGASKFSVQIRSFVRRHYKRTPRRWTQMDYKRCFGFALEFVSD